MVKTYILDTNILLQSPLSILGFSDNKVVLTGTTLQELDKKKTAPAELGYNAREVIRLIESLRKEGNSYTKGIQLPNGGLFIIEPNNVKANLPQGYSLEVPDNRIISTALSLTDQSKDKEVYLITNDVSMRINACICGVKVQGYRNEQIDTNKVYEGRRVIEECYTANMDAPEDMYENEFAVVKMGNRSALTICKNGILELIRDNETKTSYCEPRNVAQKFAMRALLAPVSEIPLVILKGPAGTAKTFLSLAAGLDGAYGGNSYDRVMITRTNTLSDEDLGFLPGTLEEKMSPLVAPFMDNLEVILRGKGEEKEQVKIQMEEILDKGIVQICSMAYMRGRSISNAFLIVDEAQNTSVNQILEIVTRAGKNCKIVLCGDPDQIDTSKLDKRNNGLMFASEHMKGSKLCAQVTFKQDETVRSELATEAAARLTV